ncbi:MAG: hypothetical protein K2N23_02505, partial [Clostridia bacterium]|nr:hypothetical protein [Clostridia bacterium]
TVRAYEIPDGSARYDGAEIFVEGKQLPAYSVKVNTSQSWTANNYQRAENGVCLFSLDGTANVVVKPKTQINYSSVMRPLSAKITPIANIQENTLTFTFKSAGEYVLEINGNAHDAIHFFVSGIDNAGAEKYSGYSSVEIFSAGLHTAGNDNRINSNNQITLKSNTLVYLADGAVVRGRFYAQNADNIAIAGRGIIDGSTFERDAQKGSVTVPLEFNYCKNILLEDFTVLDPAGWCVNFYFTESSQINDIKIITSRSNGDGISLQSCKNIEVDGCFVRTWDDSLVVKNYPRWDNRSVHGATENITFKNCTLWTDLAQSMELGYETVGVKFGNITFENITVLHAMHLAVMSIHNANNAEIRDVTFKDITVEDGRNASDGKGIIDFRVLYSSTWSDQHTSPTALGNVKGVTVENINVISARKFTATVAGCHDDRPGFEGDRFVDDVTIKNIALAGQSLSQEDCKITVSDKYARGFVFLQEGEVTGAKFLFTQTEDYLAPFKGCTVEII